MLIYRGQIKLTIIINNKTANDQLVDMKIEKRTVPRGRFLPEETKFGDHC